jgi:hypothetical protein
VGSSQAQIEGAERGLGAGGLALARLCKIRGKEGVVLVLVPVPVPVPVPVLAVVVNCDVD